MMACSFSPGSSPVLLSHDVSSSPSTAPAKLLFLSLFDVTTNLSVVAKFTSPVFTCHLDLGIFAVSLIVSSMSSKHTWNCGEICPFCMDNIICTDCAMGDGLNTHPFYFWPIACWSYFLSVKLGLA